MSSSSFSSVPSSSDGFVHVSLDLSDSKQIKSRDDANFFVQGIDSKVQSLEVLSQIQQKPYMIDNEAEIIGLFDRLKKDFYSQESKRMLHRWASKALTGVVNIAGVNRTAQDMENLCGTVVRKINDLKNGPHAEVSNEDTASSSSSSALSMLEDADLSEDDGFMPSELEFTPEEVRKLEEPSHLAEEDTGNGDFNLLFAGGIEHSTEESMAITPEKRREIQGRKNDIVNYLTQLFPESNESSFSNVGNNSVSPQEAFIRDPKKCMDFTNKIKQLILDSTALNDPIIPKRKDVIEMLTLIHDLYSGRPDAIIQADKGIIHGFFSKASTRAMNLVGIERTAQTLTKRSQELKDELATFSDPEPQINIDPDSGLKLL